MSVTKLLNRKQGSMVAQVTGHLDAYVATTTTKETSLQFKTSISVSLFKFKRNIESLKTIEKKLNLFLEKPRLLCL